jgi:hypothetical protein
MKKSRPGGHSSKTAAEYVAQALAQAASSVFMTFLQLKHVYLATGVVDECTPETMQEGAVT